VNPDELSYYWGIRVIGGKLQANISLPGLGIKYSSDGGKQW
jgi:hexosaminidase